MAGNLSNWLLRRRIGAQARSSGQLVEHRRIGNPFHAVSIEPGPRACRAAQEVEGTRFLSSEAPRLPLADCGLSTCQCRYTHYNDRRGQRDRRVNFVNPHAHQMSERRTGGGRRTTD